MAFNRKIEKNWEKIYVVVDIHKVGPYRNYHIEKIPKHLVFRRLIRIFVAENYKPTCYDEESITIYCYCGLNSNNGFVWKQDHQGW